MDEADVLIIGGGIAGLSAAWFASRAGRHVTVVDEGLHRASDLPLALINPLRGRNGRLVADGVEGMHATNALIDALRDAGHRVDGGRGLYRPLIGVTAEALKEAFWVDRLGSGLSFEWIADAPRSLGLAASVPALRMRDAGWVVPQTLLDALKAASGASLIVDRVTHLVRNARGSGGTAIVASGVSIAARSWLWCGGAWGAALLDVASTGPDAGDALYKQGSLVAVDAALSAEPLSFGLYAAPWAAGTLIGPTSEGSRARFPEGQVPAESLEHLAARVALVFGSTSPLRAVWLGVRLQRMSAAAAAMLTGIPTLTALGSRGFLMAPLLAAAWARSL